MAFIKYDGPGDGPNSGSDDDAPVQQPPTLPPASNVRMVRRRFKKSPSLKRYPVIAALCDDPRFLGELERQTKDAFWTRLHAAINEPSKGAE